MQRLNFPLTIWSGYTKSAGLKDHREPPAHVKWQCFVPWSCSSWWHWKRQWRRAKTTKPKKHNDWRSRWHRRPWAQVRARAEVRAWSRVWAQIRVRRVTTRWMKRLDLICLRRYEISFAVNNVARNTNFHIATQAAKAKSSHLNLDTPSSSGKPLPNAWAEVRAWSRVWVQARVRRVMTRRIKRLDLVFIQGTRYVSPLIMCYNFLCGIGNKS